MTDPTALLAACYREKLTELLRHQAGARFIATYDFNNTYQYVIGREDTQLSWLARAIQDLGSIVPAEAAEPVLQAPRGPDGWRALVEEDARQAQAFVDRWRARLDDIGNDRHRKLIGVIIGETLEQKRFFEQVLAGMTDLLGRRGDEVGVRVGEVLPTRWVE